MGNTAMVDFGVAITLSPVTPANWPDLEQMFERRGGPGHCWCMVWRDMPARAAATPADRKAALQARVATDTPVGLILAVDGRPVGWCSIGPQDSFRAVTPGPAEPGLWCLTCFFVSRDHRGQGLSAQLLQGALAMARDAGAKAVEATPVEPGSPSYRFMGFTEVFLDHGFHETGRVGARRHVMRLKLAGDGGPGMVARGWWAVTVSNRRHSRCKRDALPTELTAPGDGGYTDAGAASSGVEGRNFFEEICKSFRKDLASPANLFPHKQKARGNARAFPKGWWVA